nr:YjcZ family sporulation protein [Neobacillus niacini]
MGFGWGGCGFDGGFGCGGFGFDGGFNRGSSFVLIVVLFILLIIVGASFC